MSDFNQSFYQEMYGPTPGQLAYSLVMLVIAIISALWVYNDSKDRGIPAGGSCLLGCGAFLFWPAVILWWILRPKRTDELPVISSSGVEQWRSQTTTTSTPRPAKKANWEKVVNTGNMINCEFCGQPIRPIVVRCPHCHEDRAEYVDQAFKNS